MEILGGDCLPGEVDFLGLLGRSCTRLVVVDKPSSPFLDPLSFNSVDGEDMVGRYGPIRLRPIMLVIPSRKKRGGRPESGEKEGERRRRRKKLATYLCIPLERVDSISRIGESDHYHCGSGRLDEQKIITNCKLRKNQRKESRREPK